MKPLGSMVFSLRECHKELLEFETLLSSKKELDEKLDILPFFRSRRHLSAFFGDYSVSMSKYDLLEHEYTIYGDFRADLVVGDSKRHSFCLVEFEDAKPGSIFRNSGRSTSTWSSRFEIGFSQIVDWLWKVDDVRNTAQARAIFGSDTFEFLGILVIGRDEFLSPLELARLNWRSSKVNVDSKQIICMTYDQLARAMRDTLNVFLNYP